MCLVLVLVQELYNILIDARNKFDQLPECFALTSTVGCEEHERDEDTDSVVMHLHPDPSVSC